MNLLLVIAFASMTDCNLFQFRHEPHSLIETGFCFSRAAGARQNGGELAQSGWLVIADRDGDSKFPDRFLVAPGCDKPELPAKGRLA